MEIKGSAVKTIPDYLKKTYPDKLSIWLEALPETSRKYFSEPVLPSNWYPLRDAAIIPTEILGMILFQDPIKGAWQCGRFSADIALTRTYRFFIKSARPRFIIDRASRILATYYQPCNMLVNGHGENFVILRIDQFEEASKLIEARIGGWIERAMEIHGVKCVTVTISKSMANGDAYTEFLVKWE
jgi:hypothetical protein